MKEFTALIARIQKELGFKSAKAFYEHLHDRGIKSNYQHFMKIIKGEVPVQVDFVKQMALILPKWGDELIVVFSRELFPNHLHLFAVPHDVGVEEPAQEPSAKPNQAKELSAKQVNTLAGSKEAYFIFILATISRYPIKYEDLRQYFSAQILNKSLQALLQEKILLEEQGAYQTFHTEIKFPAANEYNKSLYEKFDLWDDEFGVEMGLDILLQKRFIRRISGRYLKIILQHFELIFDTIRGADEIEKRHNADVIQLSLDLKRGRLPG